MVFNLLYKNKSYNIKIEKSGSSYTTMVGDKPYDIEAISISANSISFLLNGELKTIYLASEKEKTFVSIEGECFIFEQEKSQVQKSKAVSAAKAENVVSQMPGLLVKVPVAVGDKVSAGTTLAIVEAMKMQNELRAPQDGIVKKISFKEGDQVDAFVPIVELEVLSDA